MLSSFFGDSLGDGLKSESDEKGSKATCLTDETPSPPMGRGRFVGLVNQGATCYLNSFFQFLYSLPELRELFLSLPYGSDAKGAAKVAFGIKKLMMNMSFLDTQSQSTEFLREIFGWKGTEQSDQHDMQEAMKTILFLIQDSLKGLPQGRQFEELLMGKLQNYIRCEACGAISGRPEEFFDLVLQMRSDQNEKIESVEKSLQAFFSPELLTGDNQYSCEGCQKKQDAKKGCSITSAPIYLQFTINRFNFDFNTMERVKSKDLFSFPLKLSLSELFSEPRQKEDTEYELVSAIVHVGTPYSGHYYFHTKNLIENSEEWITLNDTSIKHFDLADLKKLFGGKDRSETAHMIFYRRCSAPLKPAAEAPTKDPLYIDLMKQNSEFQSQRAEYELKKKQIRVYIVSFSFLLELGFVSGESPELILKPFEPKMFPEAIIELTDLPALRRAVVQNAQDLEISTSKFFCAKKQEETIFFQKEVKLEGEGNSAEASVLPHNSLLVCVGEKDWTRFPFFKEFKENQQPLSLKLMEDHKEIAFIVYVSDSFEDIRRKLSSLVGREVEGDHIVIDFAGDKTPLALMIKTNPLEEVIKLIEKVYIIEQSEFINTVISFKSANIPKAFTKNETIKDVFNVADEVFNIDVQYFELDIEGTLYSTADNAVKLSSIGTGTSLSIKVKCKIGSSYSLELILIDQNYFEKKIEKKLVYTNETKPVLKDVLAFLKESSGLDPNECVFYKPDSFNSPSTRINPKKLSMDSFQFGQSNMVFVRTSPGCFAFEKQSFDIFSAKNEAKDLERMFSIQVFKEESIEVLKKMILDKFQETGLFKNVNSIDELLFQRLNPFNVPAQYLIDDKPSLKKVDIKPSKLVVYENVKKLQLEPNNTPFYLRERLSDKQDYGELVEVILPQKELNKVTKTQEAFEKFICDRLGLTLKNGQSLSLYFVIYRNLCWKQLKIKEFRLRGGEEIGWKVSDKNETDDFQTDEFMALKLSLGSEAKSYNFNYKRTAETPFKIYLEDD